MVSAADGGKKLIIVAQSGASESRLELTGVPFALKRKKKEKNHVSSVRISCSTLGFFLNQETKLVSSSADVQVRCFFSRLHHVAIQQQSKNR